MQDEDVALAIAIAESLRDQARSQTDMADLEQVRQCLHFKSSSPNCVTDLGLIPY